MGSTRDLPFVYVNVATTADGKLAPANRHFVPFGSKRDQELLLELRARADAVMSGARTVGPMPVNLGPGPAKYRKMRLRKGLAEYNLRVVVSGCGNLNPRAEIFRHRFSPIIVLVTRRAPESKLRRLRRVADEVKAFGDRQLDFTQALRWLRKKWGVKKLLCEGGGEVNAGLFKEGLVDEVYHTLSPLVVGGRNAPTMADGHGFPTLASAARLRLKSLKRVGDELFLVWHSVK
jgi:2,5-diamino-6-(ribosylamino)-4(3H)-pyrimidinone 5'-phosphate reductase